MERRHLRRRTYLRARGVPEFAPAPADCGLARADQRRPPRLALGAGKINQVALTPLRHATAVSVLLLPQRRQKHTG